VVVPGKTQNCASLIADEAMRIQGIAVANQKHSAVNLNKEKQ
jgi:hypothetical protein